MVYSNINSTVFYKESEQINHEDIGHQSIVYEMEIYGKKILIVFGKIKYSFIQRNIVFLPIYLVINKKVTKQIGVAEFEKDEALELYDEEEDVIVEKIMNPITFGYFDESYLDKNSYDTSTFLKAQEEEEEEEDQEEEEEEKDELFSVKAKASNMTGEMKKAKEKLKKGIFTIDNSIKSFNLQEESELEGNKIQESFEVTPHSNWIQTFMKNEHYNIHEVESNGDCIFAVVRDAFKQIGYNTSVAKLRSIVAHEATEDIFEEHKNLYSSFKGQINEYNRELTNIKTKIEKEMPVRAKKSRDNKFELRSVLDETKTLKDKHEDLLRNKQITQSMIDDDLGNFDKINSLEDFRAFIQSSDYWGNAWTISILEYVLNIKFIILSERSHIENDLHNVLLCGEINKNIQSKNVFEPDHYIMTTFRGDHYRLIQYKEKRIFKFYEIPYHVKTLILNKCLERNAGSFYVIPDFKDMKTKFGIEEPEEEEIEESNLYDNNIVFEFYRYSNNTSKPGKGTNEKIPNNKRNLFIDLAKVDSWRRKLDDSWDEAPFEIDGKKWLSVEHYYQSSKFRKHNPDFSSLFSLSSKDSEIAKSVDLALCAGSKTGRVTGKAKKKIKGNQTLLRPKTIEIDPDFYGERSDQEREKAVFAKFNHNEDLKNMLFYTNNALLVKYLHGSPAEKDNILMNIRYKLMTMDHYTSR